MVAVSAGGNPFLARRLRSSVTTSRRTSEVERQDMCRSGKPRRCLPPLESTRGAGDSRLSGEQAKPASRARAAPDHRIDPADSRTTAPVAGSQRYPDARRSQLMRNKQHCRRAGDLHRRANPTPLRSRTVIAYIGIEAGKTEWPERRLAPLGIAVSPYSHRSTARTRGSDATSRPSRVAAGVVGSPRRYPQLSPW